MVNYTPPPPTLDHLNPIQRYMQKGELDRQDWIRLVALVAFYFIIRPYIQKAAKWWFGDEKMEEGEKAQKEYIQRRAKVSANSIRSGQKEEVAPVEEIAESQNTTTSSSKIDVDNTVVNRKSRPQPPTGKSHADQLLDWDDEPAGQPIEGGKADVTQWLDKWDKVVES